MVHERVDIARWRSLFTIDRLREDERKFVLEQRERNPRKYPDDASVEAEVAAWQPTGQSVTSPHHLAVIDFLREEALKQTDFEDKVPVDMFVFGRGEPARPEVTKVGGRPYWPSREPWPVSDSGEPLTFMAQFCFADSRDIVGDLPGDVLVVFVDAKLLEEFGPEPEYWSYVWQRLGETDLVRPEDVPPTGLEIFPVYGAIHRTWDSRSAQDWFWERNEDRWTGIIEGTKIGGIPYEVQPLDAGDCRFLCSLGSIQPAPNQPYPWVNAPEPLVTFDEQYDNRYWMLGDAGSLHLFLDPDGQVRVDEQFY